MTSVVMLGLKSGFNTQPPKGGCHRMWYITQMPTGFQHTAARRRATTVHFTPVISGAGFNTQPPEGGCTRH